MPSIGNGVTDVTANCGASVLLVAGTASDDAGATPAEAATFGGSLISLSAPTRTSAVVLEPPPQAASKTAVSRLATARPIDQGLEIFMILHHS
ncbi:MAG: hypothetical protein R3E87_19280 [Burkholderiaceae bacterium]